MTIGSEELKEKMASVVERYGEWTAMGIQLADGVSTIDPPQPDRRLLRIVQLAEDLARKPLAECRVLDLACLEGQYGIECALHEAEVVGIEGREANIAKAQFVKEALHLNRFTLFQDDVRNLSRDKYGTFDIVICSGILYHLDAPDVFQFVQRIAEVCHGLTILDTLVSMKDEVCFDFEGQKYWGRYYQEHTAETKAAERLKDRWASIDNVKSVWLTRASLYNLLQHVEFSSVLECLVPSMLELGHDRTMFVAVKNPRSRILSSAPTDSLKPELWPEHRPFKVNDIQAQKTVIRRIKSLVPGFVRSPLKRIRASLTRSTAVGSDRPWEWTQPWQRR